MPGEFERAWAFALLAGSGRQAGAHLATIGRDTIIVILAGEHAMSGGRVAMREHALRVAGAGERERAGRRKRRGRSGGDGRRSRRGGRCRRGGRRCRPVAGLSGRLCNTRGLRLLWVPTLLRWLFALTPERDE